jgi:hypothetical protein
MFGNAHPLSQGGGEPRVVFVARLSVGCRKVYFTLPCMVFVPTAFCSFAPSTNKSCRSCAHFCCLCELLQILCSKKRSGGDLGDFLCPQGTKIEKTHNDTYTPNSTVVSLQF